MRQTEVGWKIGHGCFVKLETEVSNETKWSKEFRRRFTARNLVGKRSSEWWKNGYIATFDDTNFDLLKIAWETEASQHHFLCPDVIRFILPGIHGHRAYLRAAWILLSLNWLISPRWWTTASDIHAESANWRPPPCGLCMSTLNGYTYGCTRKLLHSISCLDCLG